MQFSKIYTILAVNKILAPNRAFFRIQIYKFMAQQSQNFLTKYLTEVKEEMRKVTWPTSKQVRNTTILVIIISLAIAAFFGGLDFIFTYILETLLAN